MRTAKLISPGATLAHIFLGTQYGRPQLRFYREIGVERLSRHQYTGKKKYASLSANMDSSMVESVVDDGDNSDYFSPAPAPVVVSITFDLS
jgi:hypothetical protein